MITSLSPFFTRNFQVTKTEATSFKLAHHYDFFNSKFQVAEVETAFPSFDYILYFILRIFPSRMGMTEKEISTCSHTV